MGRAILGLAALAATFRLASSIGSAIVINSCDYDVNVCNVPAANEGFSEYTQVLKPQGIFSQEYTMLNGRNGEHDGWAIKLYKLDDLARPFQYEYTYQGKSDVWFDMSGVDGNPWGSGNWFISSDNPSCTPDQTWYRHSTDDAYGMQANCTSEASVTLNLCANSAENTASSSAIPSSTAVASSSTSPVQSSTPADTPPAYSSPADTPPAYSTTTDAPPAYSTTEATWTRGAYIPTSLSSTTSATWTRMGGHSDGRGPRVQAAYKEALVATSTSPTTFATETTAAVEDAPGHTVYEVETAVVTEFVTAIYTAPSRIKRHEHGAGHHHAF